VRLNSPSGAGEERYLVWFGGLIAVVLVVAALVVVEPSQRRLSAGISQPAFAAEQPREVSIALPDRSSCGEIGTSDLRSPREGLWFQSNCVAVPEAPLIATNTSCNRTSLNPTEYAAIGSGLFVYRQAPGSQGWLWYASAESCFDLVSTRVVTAVCADQTLSFSLNASACSSHGGVAAWVNGR
jgi:hypothetical protein